MRSILLHIHDDDCLNARLQVALDLARCFDGHLTCLQATPMAAGVPGDLYGAMTAQLLPELRKAADALCERLERRLAAEGVSWDWIQEDCTPTDQLLRRAGLSDIMVLGSCDPLRSTAPSKLVGDVVLRARTPLLVVPPQAEAFDCDGPAVVAWNGTPEACRALRSALPLLARASSVSLVTIRSTNEDDQLDRPPIEGAEYLSRHGISCEMIDLPLGTNSVGMELAGTAVERSACVLIMGAYGHSRLRETIWGGVTRELLSDPPLPIFACH